MHTLSPRRNTPRLAGIAELVGRFVRRFAYDDRDSDAVRTEKTAVLLVVGCCCAAGLIWAGMYYLVFGWGLIAGLPLVFIVVMVPAIFIAHITRAHRIAVYAQLICIILLTALAQWNIGGVFDSGFVLAWAFLGPIGALFFFPFRKAVPWFVLFLACLVITVVFDDYFARHGQPVPAGARTLFFIMNLSGSTTVVFVFAAYLVNAAAVQRKRADDLLLNTLPGKVVKILKSGATTTADYYESATVLFADIVGSTPLFADLSPTQVVDWLNDVFSAFDRVVATHGVEKIRTIGDSYMVAAGVPDRRGDHAKVMASVALDMISALEALPSRHGRKVEFRFGINSGPLVAGVIGRARLQYDLWGDTVNLAARMESHSEPGRVHLTETTYELIQDEYECECRGTIPIKGKGTMTTWFLIGPKARTTSA